MTLRRNLAHAVVGAVGDETATGSKASPSVRALATAAVVWGAALGSSDSGEREKGMRRSGSEVRQRFQTNFERIL